MKSVKPGRGPSMMGGIYSVFAAVFGVVWTALAPGAMKLFGICFILLAIVQAAYHFRNAAANKRFSLYDITEQEEEKDPLQAYMDQTAQEDGRREAGGSGGFCPYCGAKADASYVYCRVCGKKLPNEN